MLHRRKVIDLIPLFTLVGASRLGLLRLSGEARLCLLELIIENGHYPQYSLDVDLSDNGIISVLSILIKSIAVEKAGAWLERS